MGSEAPVSLQRSLEIEGQERYEPPFDPPSPFVSDAPGQVRRTVADPRQPATRVEHIPSRGSERPVSLLRSPDSEDRPTPSLDLPAPYSRSSSLPVSDPQSPPGSRIGGVPPESSENSISVQRSLGTSGSAGYPSLDLPAPHLDHPASVAHPQSEPVSFVEAETPSGSETSASVQRIFRSEVGHSSDPLPSLNQADPIVHNPLPVIRRALADEISPPEEIPANPDEPGMVAQPSQYAESTGLKHENSMLYKPVAGGKDNSVAVQRSTQANPTRTDETAPVQNETPDGLRRSAEVSSKQPERIGNLLDGPADGHRDDPHSRSIDSVARPSLGEIRERPSSAQASEDVLRLKAVEGQDPLVSRTGDLAYRETAQQSRPVALQRSTEMDRGAGRLPAGLAPDEPALTKSAGRLALEKDPNLENTRAVLPSPGVQAKPIHTLDLGESLLARHALKSSLFLSPPAQPGRAASMHTDSPQETFIGRPDRKTIVSLSSSEPAAILRQAQTLTEPSHPSRSSAGLPLPARPVQASSNTAYAVYSDPGVSISSPAVINRYPADETVQRRPENIQSPVVNEATIIDFVQRASSPDGDEIVGESEKSEVDLDELARLVYPMIKRLLAIEHERLSSRR